MDATKRNATYRRAGYTHALTYTRMHTKGALAGLTTEGFVAFCSAAEQWIRDVSTPTASGKLGYRIQAHTIEVL